ncbi:flavin-containing monooxygenase [Lacibacter sp.]|uniref:flavin-containing monooxygenase n=1 Tax=Lacibacter sp. TaxID=1915409 RepID=UPI002B4AE2C8|nr:FAD-dependent oxidoreductase [Lacibacter sp.]HLP39478.1 FAD-dependent oxidoreductase [Lacibacter sp.]
MEKVKTIGIIGAGLSGLVTAKTCLEYGYKIRLYEKEAELGGVWASSRRYPGVTTQNTKDTYFFSDFPMPRHYPQWPSGEQVQSYLTAYAKKFHVFPFIQFSHEIRNVRLIDNKWLVTSKHKGTSFTEQVDFLIICNGTFSDPFIPEIPGMESFIDAGGQILHSTQFQSTEIAKNKRLVVVGYGKSASDLVTAASATAKTTHLVFREPKWKIPRYVKGINMKYILLNRLGEALIKPADQHNYIDRIVHKTGLAEKMLSFMESYIIKKQMLRELDLIPSSSLKEQAFGEITLETPQFFEKISKGEIIIKQNEIASFKGKQVMLKNGEEIECDLVVFAIGFKQTIPFLPDPIKERFMDEKGNYLLYHHILPAGVPSLAFVGYNSSIQCPISSEFAALWVCEYLKGRIPKPTAEQIRNEGIEFIRWRSTFRPNGASRGLSTMPGTIHHVDMLLKEMNAPLPFWSLLPDWLLIIKPSRYKKLRKKIIRRNHNGTGHTIEQSFKKASHLTVVP